MTEPFDQFDSDLVRVLQEVRMFSHPDLPNAVGVIELSFPDHKVFVCIQDDYDTLHCSRHPPLPHLGYTQTICPSFWEPLLGKTLTDAWQMTSDRGYPDAVQLRFRDSANAGPYTVVQLYGEASQITISEYQVVRQSEG